MAEFASGLRVRMGEPHSSDEGGVVVTVLQGGLIQAPQPALPNTRVHPLPASLGGASRCTDDLSLESGGQERFMAFSISTVGPKTNQNPLAYPFLRSRAPCCQMQIRRKF